MSPVRDDVRYEIISLLIYVFFLDQDVVQSFRVCDTQYRLLRGKMRTLINIENIGKQ